jgi:hypothetical protein
MMRARVATIYFNENQDKTIVEWSDNFTVERWVLKMDVLKDTAKIVEKAYQFVHQDKLNKDSNLPRTIR